MNFFIPGLSPANAETSYDLMVGTLKKQLSWRFTPRRIFRLSYVHDKKKVTVEVGRMENHRHGHESLVVAILESTTFTYIICARAADSGEDLNILVSKDEITLIEDFDTSAAIETALPAAA